MMHNLVENLKGDIVEAATAAGQTAIESIGVDMSGYDGVMFAVCTQAITAGGVQSINAAGSATLNGTYADLYPAGGVEADGDLAIADDDDNKLILLDIYKPASRFVRAEISRATQNSAFGEIVAYRYGKRDKPVIMAAAAGKTLLVQYAEEV